MCYLLIFHFRIWSVIFSVSAFCQSESSERISCCVCVVLLFCSSFYDFLFSQFVCQLVNESDL